MLSNIISVIKSEIKSIILVSPSKNMKYQIGCDLPLPGNLCLVPTYSLQNAHSVELQSWNPDQHLCTMASVKF